MEGPAGRRAARLRRLCGVVAGLLLCAAGARAATFDYLYIEANEGGSSGGHVAVAFGDEVYHFQYHPGGLLKLRSDDLATFRLRYTVLENRAIEVSRIFVSDETRALLRDAFARRLQIEHAQHARLDELRADRALFELWRRRRAGEAVAVPVRGAGYFDLRAASAGASRGLIDLRDRIAARHGADFIERRRAAVRAEMAALPLHAARAEPLRAADEYPLHDPSAATRFNDALTRLTALDVLAASPPLRPDALRAATSTPPLSAAERRQLARFAAQLRNALVALSASRRSDWGYPLLLGMARLAAIEASLAAGRLLVLDAYDSDAPLASIPDDASRAPFVAALLEQNRAAAARQRAELFAQPSWREADYSASETALNALIETERASAGGPLRLRRERALPAWTAPRTDLVLPVDAVPDPEAELAAARRAEAAYADGIASAYAYNLITRNCVSEIFDVIATAIAASDRAAPESALTARLGGVVRTRGTLNFIPFVSADAVRRSYTVVATERWPSFRERTMLAQETREPRWRVRLRESNTVTATAYRPPASDSTFLFFTDEAWPARPLLGAANLVYAAGAGVVGLATWPADGGRRLSSGAWGIVFSLPELAFVNVRKGGTAYVTAAELQ